MDTDDEGISFILYVVAVMVFGLLFAVMAQADCPYSGYVPGSPGVVVDKSFHPEEQPGPWEEINGTWYKAVWVMEEGVRQGQRVFNHRLAYQVFNETTEYKEWRKENPYTPCNLESGQSLDPYVNMTWPNGSLEYVKPEPEFDREIDLGFTTVNADEFMLAIVELMIG